MAEPGLVRSLSTSRRSTVKTSSDFSRAMAAFSSTQSTRRCATAQCCGRRDGADFPGAAGRAWSVTNTRTFQTRIQRAVSGRELRALDYPYPLWQFALVYDFLRDNPAAGYDELRTLLGL